jgi:hypothetical protein
MSRCTRLLALGAVVASLGSFGCSSSSSGQNGAPAMDASAGDDTGTAVDASADGPYDQPGTSTTVMAFDHTNVFFGPSMNQRTVDAPVTFPSTGTYSSIILHVALTCPTGGCDVWDRFGSISMVTPVSTSDAGTVETLTEIARFVTPYGLPPAGDPQPTWDFDVTNLRPMLSGDLTLRAFIDTWVPQSVTNQGYGWVVTASFEMTGGTPAYLPVAVVPIWTWTTSNKEPTEVVYGDPAFPISSSLPAQTVTLPVGASSYSVRTFITGHGQANLDNCSEFCSKQHTWTVGTTPNTLAIWRTDCANFPSSGTYQYSRAGWCPGADVQPWQFDVTSQVAGAPTTTISYDVEAYTNTCNGASDGGGVCTGCQAGESCQYDGSDHTQPFYYVSSLLIGYR